MQAVRHGSAPVAKLLLAAHSDVNAVGAQGNTPLLLAAAQEDAGIVKLLVAAGAKVNSRNKVGASPLMVAAGLGRRLAARALLEAGADKSLRNSKREIARDIAKAAGHVELANQL
jgi:uncharacterized protein